MGKYLKRWEQVAEAMLDELCRNPAPQLPGIGPLCKQYSASRSTIEQCLKHLEFLKVLEPSSPGKRRKVNIDQLEKLRNSSSNPERPKFLIIGPEPSYQLPHTLANVIATAKNLGAKSNIEVEYLNAPDSPATLRRSLRVIKPQGIITYICPVFCAEVALSLEIPTAGIGMTKADIPNTYTKHITLLEQGFKKAWDAGHTRVVSPLLNKRDKLHQTLLTQLIASKPAHLPTLSPNYHLPAFSAKSAREYHQEFSKIFQYTPPTCLILGNHEQLLMTLSFLNQRQIKIAEDISIICLSHHPDLQFFHPSIAHFDIGEQRACEISMQLLLESKGQLLPSQDIEIAPTWHPGMSLSPHRKL